MEATTVSGWTEAGWIAFFVESAGRGLILLAGTALAICLLSRASVAARQALWAMSLAGLCLLPLLVALLPAWSVLPVWMDAGVVAGAPVEPVLPPQPRMNLGRGAVFLESERAKGSVAPSATGSFALPAGPPPAVEGDQIVRLAPSEPSGAQAAMERQGAQRASSPSVAGFAAVAWAAGATAILLRATASALVLFRLSRTARRVQGGPALSTLEELRGRLDIRRSVQLFTSVRRSMPMSWGLFQPSILLPEKAESWTQGRLRAVLLHELAHVRHWDHVTNLIAQVACALHWFNPLVWVAARGMAVEGECACDDQVIAGGVRASQYATHLLDIATGYESGRLQRFGAIAMARKSRIERRLSLILDERRDRSGLTRRAFAAALAGTAAAVLTLAALRTGSAVLGAAGTPAAGAGTEIYRGNAARTGMFDAAGAPLPGPLTRASLELESAYRCSSGFVLSDGVAFFQGQNNQWEGGPGHPPPGPPRVFAVEAATGKVLWQADAGDDNLSTPAVAGDSIYFASSDARVVRAVAKTGKTIWQVQARCQGTTSYSRPSPVLVSSGLVCVAFRDGTVHAFDRATGEERWEASCGAMSDLALAESDSRILCSGRQHVGALDARTGHELWRRDLRPTSHPVAAGGKLLVVGGAVDKDGFPAQQTLYALSAADGSPLWEHASDSGNVHRIGADQSECACPAVAGSLVLYSTSYGHLYAVDGATGKRVWKAVTEGPLFSGPSVAGGIIYLAGFVGKVYAFNLDSGALLWERIADGTLLTSPVVAGGTVYAVDFNCGIVAVPGEASAPAAREPPAGGAARATVSPTAKAGTISGRVLSAATGGPVAMAYVGTGDFGDSGGSNYARHRSSGLHVATQTDAEGRFVLRGLASTGKGKAVEAHPLVVIGQDCIRADVKVELPEGEGREVEVHLRPAAVLRIEPWHHDMLRRPVLLRLEALDGHRFIPPGRDPHLSSFASSAWSEVFPSERGRGFTFTGLEEGEYAIDAFRLPESSQGSPRGIHTLAPEGTNYLGGARVGARSGRTVEVRVNTQWWHSTTLTLGLPEIPADLGGGNPILASPFVVISRNVGLLAWDDGLAHGLEDQRLGRLEKQALLVGALPLGSKSFTVRGLPLGTYAVFVGPVVYLRGDRITLTAGSTVATETLWAPPKRSAQVRVWGMDRPLDLAAGVYSVEELCRRLTEATASRPRFEPNTFLAAEKVTIARPLRGIWEVVEEICGQRGWSTAEEGEDTLTFVRWPRERI